MEQINMTQESILRILIKILDKQNFILANIIALKEISEAKLTELCATMLENKELIANIYKLVKVDQGVVENFLCKKRPEPRKTIKQISANGANKTKIMSKSGRQLYRHSSNMGTVMVWNDNGTEKHTLILDAKYRTTATTSATEPYTTKTGYPTGTSSNYKDITDEVFNTSGSSSSQDTMSSKERTDLIAITSNAANHCRQQLVDGVGCDLPNINCLVRIYAEREQLDSMDPTVREYSQYSLTNWFNSGGVWSSSSYVSDFVLYVYSLGNVYGLSATYSAGVVPVLEI